MLCALGAIGSCGRPTGCPGCWTIPDSTSGRGEIFLCCSAETDLTLMLDSSCVTGLADDEVCEPTTCRLAMKPPYLALKSQGVLHDPGDTSRESL